MRPLLIELEGLDACGKGTQVELLVTRLREWNGNVATIYKFPVKDTVTGKLIYEMMNGERGVTREADPAVVTDDCSHELDPHANALALQALMLANRLEATAEIERLKRDGRTIIFDRYVDSGIVYGRADGLDPDWCKLTNAPFPQPDLHILLDIDVDDSFKRRPERQNAYEANRARMEKVAYLYREWWAENGANSYSNHWVTVDGRREPGFVHAEIWAAVRELGEA